MNKFLRLISGMDLYRLATYMFWGLGFKFVMFVGCWLSCFC